MKALVTGATGAVGGRLSLELRNRDIEVRALVRDRSKAGNLEEAGCEVHEGDVLKPDSLRGAGEGVDVAYYLVHGMGRGSDGDFVEREREAAGNFARMARDEGVERVVYLGGLGTDPESEHLLSRHETAGTLASKGPALTYFRAAMLIGVESESYRMLRQLVAKLPVMLTPRWLKTPTQPIALEDAVAYLAAAPEVPESKGREIEIGGPEVLSYGQMLDRMAIALGHEPRPKLPVPVLTPTLSSHWIGLVTDVDAGVAKPLIEGLSTETVVTDPSGALLFDIEPMGVDAALERAVEDEKQPVG